MVHAGGVGMMMPGMSGDGWPGEAGGAAQAEMMKARRPSKVELDKDDGLCMKVH